MDYLGVCVSQTANLIQMWTQSGCWDLLVHFTPFIGSIIFTCSWLWWIISLIGSCQSFRTLLCCCPSHLTSCLLFTLTDIFCQLLLFISSVVLSLSITAVIGIHPPSRPFASFYHFSLFNRTSLQTFALVNNLCQTEKPKDGGLHYIMVNFIAVLQLAQFC